MTGSFWLNVLIFAVYGFVCGRLNLWYYHWRNKHEQRRFVMLLQVLFEDANMTFVSAAGTEEEALKALKAKLANGDELDLKEGLK